MYVRKANNLFVKCTIIAATTPQQTMLSPPPSQIFSINKTSTKFIIMVVVVEPYTDIARNDIIITTRPNGYTPLCLNNLIYYCLSIL